MNNQELRTARKTEAGCLAFALFLLGLAMSLCLISVNGSALCFFSGLIFLFVGGFSLIPCFDQRRLVKELEKKALLESRNAEQENQDIERQPATREVAELKETKLASPFIPRPSSATTEQREAKLRELEEKIKTNNAQTSVYLDQQTEGKIMRYWIFKCNPEYYRLDERLNDPEQQTTWRIKQHREEVQSGDIAFIWQTGRVRGIRAILHITSAPAQMDELETEKKYYIEPGFQSTPMVRVRAMLQDRFACINAQNLQNIPELAGMSVFRGPHQATNFRVTGEEGKFLLDYIKAERGV